MADYGNQSTPCKPADVEKDPDDTALLTFYWAEELDGDTIATKAFVLPDGLTEGVSAISGSKVTLKVTGGDCGQQYRVTCRITTTTGGLQFDKTIRVLVRER